MKHTIYIHASKSIWNDRAEIKVFSHDMSEHGYVLLEAREINAPDADSINWTQIELDQIEKERTTLADAYHGQMKRLDDRKAKLQCLEMTS